jgi:3-keto-disaccharide hydrolase
MRLTPLLILLIALPAAAADDSWTDLLTGDKLDAFSGKTDGWKWAKAVALDPTNPKKLAFEPGAGILVNSPKGTAPDLYTKEKYGDLEIHVEFLIAKGSNSGVKFHGLYEIQILDSYGKKGELTGDDCGGIYPRAELKPRYHYLDKGIAPRVNACKAPGEWQTLEATFRAPKFDRDGKKTANARIVKATLNGQVIHEDQELLTPTGHNHTKPEVATGPLMLQGDHGPVAFRNIRVRVPAGK